MELYQDLYPTQLYFGKIQDYKKELLIGKKCIIVTTTTSSYKLGIIDELKKLFEEEKIEYFIYDKITPNPLYINVEECVELTKQFGGDFIIGIGGGSAIDAAKSVSLMKNGVDIINDVVKNTGLPLTGILTLSGSGTEVTPYSILTFPNHSKKSIKSHMFLKNCIIDAEYQNGLTPQYRACLVVDILSHCLEAYLSIKATERSMQASVDGIKLILEQYNRQTKEFAVEKVDIIHSSIIGGAAITVAGTSVPHGLGYYITTTYNVSHGFACGIFSKAFLKLAETQEISGPKLKKLYEQLQLENGELGTIINDIVKKHMTPFSLNDMEKELDIIANEFFSTGKNKQHPDVLTENDVKSIISQSF